MTFALIRNAVNFYLSFVDDSIDAVEVEFMRWHSYWLGHEDDFLPYSTVGVLLSAKEIHTYPSLKIFWNVNLQIVLQTKPSHQPNSRLPLLKVFQK